MIQLGLIGKKLSHSRSPEIMDKYFRNLGIDACYSLFPLDDISAIVGLISSRPGLIGFNVTIPYKELIIPYLAELTPEALEIGAVNTVKIYHDSQSSVPSLTGHNTDVSGFKRALSEFAAEADAPLSENAVILGTGGASKAVACALRQLGLSDITFVSRTPCKSNTISYRDLNADLISRSRLIINTTPLGLWPETDSCPPIDYKAVKPGTLCFDLIYNPLETMFMKRCKASGAKVSNGLKMLEYQAWDALEYWNIIPD